MTVSVQIIFDDCDILLDPVVPLRLAMSGSICTLFTDDRSLCDHEAN